MTLPREPSKAKSLIERLEEATGPDRVLDCDIREAVEGWKNIGGGWREWPDGRTEQYNYGYALPYTTSIDAALTLARNDDEYFDMLKALVTTARNSGRKWDGMRAAIICALEMRGIS